MTPAEQALDNAIPLEVKKDGLQQRQNGDWVLRFVIQAADMDERITRAAMGTRFMAALVEVGTDELPVHQPAKETKVSPASHARPQPVPDKPPAAAKRDWETLQPAQQAGIRSHDIRFAQFLEEEYPQAWREHQDAADCIRSICDIHSRVELGTNHAKRVLWHQLDKHYQAWEAKIRLNA